MHDVEITINQSSGIVSAFSWTFIFEREYLLSFYSPAERNQIDALTRILPSFRVLPQTLVDFYKRSLEPRSPRPSILTLLLAQALA